MTIRSIFLFCLIFLIGLFFSNPFQFVRGEGKYETVLLFAFLLFALSFVKTNLCLAPLTRMHVKNVTTASAQNFICQISSANASHSEFCRKKEGLLISVCLKPFKAWSGIRIANREL